MGRNRYFRAGCRIVKQWLGKPDKRWRKHLSPIFLQHLEIHLQFAGSNYLQLRLTVWNAFLELHTCALSKLQLSFSHNDQVVSTIMLDVVCLRAIFSQVWHTSNLLCQCPNHWEKSYNKMMYFPPVQLKLFRLVVRAWSFVRPERMNFATFLDKRGIELSSKGCSSISQWI